MLRLLTLILALAAAVSAHADEPDPAPTGEPVAATSDAPAWMRLIPHEVEEQQSLVAAVCCKICTKSKACGNTCISRKKTCHKPPGCACNAQ